MEYKLIQGEIGEDDFSSFLDELPTIDIIYNAPPNKEMMSFWHKYQTRSYTYDKFFGDLIDIYKMVDARICYIESGSNYDDMINALWYPYVQTKEITYSAPNAKKKIPYKLIIASYDPISINYNFKYSHELLDIILNCSRMNVFDPCIGKGLLCKYAIKYGHNCYGIEYDENRLQCAKDLYRMM
jgi:hypothetical protein